MPGEELASTRWNHANPVLEVSDVSRAIAYYRDVCGLSSSWMWENRIGEYTPITAGLRSTCPARSSPRRRG
jgi:hypothetical protein